MKVKFSRQFTKQYDKAPIKIRQAFKDRLGIFKEDKYNPLLNNHSLTGQLKYYQSINITGGWRAIFKEVDNGEVIFFVMMGTHSQLYS